MNERGSSDLIKEVIELVSRYIESKLILYKLNITERLAVSSSRLITFILVFVMLLNMINLLTFALAFWIGEMYGSVALGFLILTVIYLLIIIILYIFRKSLISKQIITMLKDLLF